MRLGCLKKPDISNIKVWGSISYLKQPNPASKLDSRATSGVLVGFGHNQYKVYIPSTSKLLFTRDITILEGQFLTDGDQNLASSKPTSQVDANVPTEPIGKLVDLETTSGASHRATSEVPSVAGTPASPDPDAETLSQHSSDTSADELAFLLFNSVEQQDKDPISYTEAMQRPNKANWQQAMQKEIADLSAQNTWQRTKLPPNRKVLKGRWVYKPSSMQMAQSTSSRLDG